MIQLSDCRRLFQLFRLLLRYELSPLLPWRSLRLPLTLARRLLFFSRRPYQQLSLGVRLRLALQEMGPLWIKIGQLLSTRRDLLPPEIADQLALLQDQVESSQTLSIHKVVEQLLEGPFEQWFSALETQPFARASIAQVHKATLRVSGRQVVIKVIRPGVKTQLLADLRLLTGIAYLVQQWSTEGKRLRPLAVVREYEKTVLDELNLLREAANAIQLRRNFDNICICRLLS